MLFSKDSIVNKIRGKRNKCIKVTWENENIISLVIVDSS